MNPLTRIIVVILVILLSACTSSKQMDQARMDFDQKNYAQAYDGLLALAKRGDPEAQYAVGYMSYYGMGTPKDESLARQWIRQSAESGYPDAIQAYKMLAHDKNSNEPDIVPTADYQPRRHHAPNPLLHWFKETISKKELV